jgi:hypothetical protein
LESNMHSVKINSMNRSFRFIFLVLFLLPSLLEGQQKEIRVLFVGNSYTYMNNLAHIVAIMSEGTDTRLVTRKSVAGGAFLWQHWNGDRGLATRAMIAEGDFDIVVLQDNSMAAIEAPDSTIKYMKLFTAYNREFGAETYLFNTWAREKVPQFQSEIDEVYTRAAAESGATRIPVGPAWELALDIRPTAALFASDGSHPSNLGTLLAASVFVRTITGELPDELPPSFQVTDAEGETIYLMGPDPLDREFCARIAEEIAGSY